MSDQPTTFASQVEALRSRGSMPDNELIEREDAMALAFAADRTIAQQAETIRQLRDFKALVHRLLDAAGVDPCEGEACRVGKRLRKLTEERDEARQCEEDATTACGNALARVQELLNELAAARTRIAELEADQKPDPESKPWIHSDKPCDKCRGSQVYWQYIGDSMDAWVICRSCGRTYCVDGADS